MARIPPVRCWRVRYITRHGRFDVYVHTINKRFAAWIARDEALANIGASAFISARATVSLAKQERAL